MAKNLEAPTILAEADLTALIQAAAPSARPTLRIFLEQIAHARDVAAERREKLAWLKKDASRRHHAAELLDKASPSDPFAESVVLGAILMRPGVISTHGVSKDLFWDEAHRLIFAAILQVRETGRPVDVPHVMECLKANGQWETMGGAHELANVIQSSVGDARLAEYVETLTDYRRRRALLFAALETIKGVHDWFQTTEDLLTAATDRLKAIR